MVERDELPDALDASLAALEAGASLESVLARHPALSAELRPLLVAALSAGAGDELARVPAGAQIASRAQFLARAVDRRPAVPPAPIPGWWPRQLSRLRSWFASRPLAGGSLLARAVIMSLVVAAGLGAGASGAVAASAQSLPGDPLYGVKRSVESTQLMLAPDEPTRARLQAEFDDRRVHEVLAVANQRRQVLVEFTGTLISMDGPQSQHWLVSGVAVLVGPQVPVDGEPLVGAQVDVQGTVDAAGEVLAQRVTVLPHHVAPLEATPTVTAAGPVTSTATAALPPVQSTAAATNAAPVPASATPSPTSPNPPSRTPAPTPTPVVTSTDDHGGPSPSNTPDATEGGGGGGGSGDHTQTPAPTEGGDHGGSPTSTPRATDDGGDHGANQTQTPEPTDGGGPASPSPSTTPKPGD